MDGIGAVVNILQLCEYITKSVIAVKETLNAFEELPSSTAEKQRYLTSLVSIIDLVAKNRILQTGDIVPHLQLTQDHISSLQKLLKENLQRVQQKTFKNFSHVLFKGDSDKQKINAALQSLEHDKSNLNLYILNNFGSQFGQYLEMSSKVHTQPKVMTIAEMNARDEAQSQMAKSSNAADSSSGSNTNADHLKDTRSWKGIEQHEDADGIFGDKNAKPKTSGTDGRTWENIKQQKKSKAVFGDVY